MKELINLFKAVTLVNDAVPPIFTVEGKLVSAFNLELASLGYTMSPELMEAVSALSPSAFKESRDLILAPLAVAENINVTLFANFPYSVPDQDEYLMKRVVSFFANDLLAESKESVVLSCGHAIYKGFFDLKEFGVCPVCQRQVPELQNSGEGARYDFASVTPLKVLTYADGEFLRSAVLTLMSRQSSLSEAEKTFIKTYAQVEDRAFTSPIFKETLPLVWEYTANKASLVAGISGLTDILRIASFLSNPEADLSLKENVKFSLSTSEKKAILKLMELSVKKVEQAAEDLMRHRERWLKLGKLLAVGSTYNRTRYPNVAAAFNLLRNDQKSIPTFSRFTEAHIRAGGFDGEGLIKLASRPAEYARKLDAILRSSKTDHDAAITVFKHHVVGKVTTKLLFELSAFFKNRLNTDLSVSVAQDAMYAKDKAHHRSPLRSMIKESWVPPKQSKADGFNAKRAFFPKGSMNNVKVIPDIRKNFNPALVANINAVIDVLALELATRLSAEEKMGKVFIANELAGVLVPFNRRGDSNSTSTYTKGSRYPFNGGDIVRLFTYWKNDSDVDLSLISYDENLAFINQISFTNTSDTGFQHSGDIQRAPHGAAEYIDIDLAKIDRRIRYIAMSVISFSGNQFKDFECFAGFMARDGLKSGEKFEPAAVELKFDLNQEKTQIMPVIFDLMTREIVYVDMAVGDGAGRAVASSAYGDMLSVFLNLAKFKPTVYDVLMVNAIARGQVVDNREEADVVFDLSTDIDEILSVSGI